MSCWKPSSAIRLPAAAGGCTVIMCHCVRRHGYMHKTLLLSLLPTGTPPDDSPAAAVNHLCCRCTLPLLVGSEGRGASAVQSAGVSASNRADVAVAPRVRSGPKGDSRMAPENLWKGREKRKERAGAPRWKGSKEARKENKIKKSPGLHVIPGPSSCNRILCRRTCYTFPVVLRRFYCFCCCYCATFSPPAESGNRQFPDWPRFLPLGWATERWLLLHCTALPRSPMASVSSPSYLRTENNLCLQGSFVPSAL